MESADEVLGRDCVVVTCGGFLCGRVGRVWVSCGCRAGPGCSLADVVVAPRDCCGVDVPWSPPIVI